MVSTRSSTPSRPTSQPAYEAALTDGGKVSSPTNSAGEGANRTNVMHSPTAELLSRVAQHLADGSIIINLQQTFELGDATQALAAFNAGHTLGKISPPTQFEHQPAKQVRMRNRRLLRRRDYREDPPGTVDLTVFPARRAD
jgi:hypothetical protein